MNRVILTTIIVLHTTLIVVNAAAIPILVMLPHYLYTIQPSILSILMGVAISTPTICFIVRLGYHWSRCPITDLENHYREKLGLPKMRGFLNHYLFNPLAEWRNELCSKP